ncbi:MAG: hypothetical protein DHS20C17_16890 [Cyclobacteriaceae bacterium]|nr:MAG: hypothetical protein DHS20C17_16890 [Cyclobacteriaceae bacterium]
MKKSIRKILICDNEEDMLEIVTQIFTKRGYEVLATRSVESMLESIPGYNPQVILLDLNLPGMGGEQAAKILKEKPETKSIPIILISGRDDSADIADKLDLAGHIGKPFSITTLITTISSCFDDQHSESD